MSTPEEYFAGLPFPPDPFQVEATAAVAAGRSVVVTAPTGSGKTLVAEVAVHIAVTTGKRAIYTTPLKALSNQKYGDFSRIYGANRVGLLTGDNSINPEAPVLVMTTEVLRNMIYVDSEALDNLGVVVLDEVHYLQDPFRGMVWEEIIIHLPAGIPIVALSATVSNAGEFTEWVADRRGGADLVVESHRPVPLESLYLVKDRSRAESLLLLPVFTGKRPNEQAARLSRPGRSRGSRLRTPRRYEVAELLRDEGLLPAIYFVFSRAGCDAAVEQVVGSGVRLTTSDEAGEIARFAAERTAHIAPEDLAVLGYGRWSSLLEAGVAAHHAGMVPAFKETVEELFLRGLVRLVFATETLSLGINMPARSVVLESLTKFTGETHELLRPGDYTQLTGRAGRRGIDSQGTAIVLYSRYVPFERVAGIAAAGSHPLRSSFRPNYNMAVNLIANYERDQAERLLAASFGQYQRSRERIELEAALAEARERIVEFRLAAECTRGDVWEFFAGEEGGITRSHGSVMRGFARDLTAGDVLTGVDGPGDGRSVMLARGFGSNPRVLVLSDDGRLRRLRPDQLSPATTRIGTVDLPVPFRPRVSGYRREVIAAMRAVDPEEESAAYEDEVEERHPVAGCPDLEDHRRWAKRLQREERDERRLQRRIGRLSEGILEEFEEIRSLLERWGYVKGWELTAWGDRLRLIYNEMDLLVAESALRGHLSDLDPPQLAALVSVFVYDPRRGPEVGTFPDAGTAARWEGIEELSRTLEADESDHRLTVTRPPEPGFAAATHAWASGLDLEDILEEDDDLAAGDFVRTCRQLIDLLRQIRDAFPDLATEAAAAVRAIDRGVVAAGGLE